MIKYGGFTCERSIDTFGQRFILVNCFHTVLRTEPSMKQEPCSELCSTVDAVIPSYQDFQTLNLSRLVDLCEDEYNTQSGPDSKSSPESCDYAISTSFNFTDLTWKSDGQSLDNVTWKSFAYPKFNDILVICGMKLTNSIDRQNGYLGRVVNNVRYCLVSSTDFDFDRKNYFAHQYQNIEALATNRLGYYFCEGDELTSTNLKLGTFN